MGCYLTANKSLFLLSCFVLSSYYLFLPALANALSSRTHKCIDHERQALLEFKHGIEVDPLGLLTSWGHQENCCTWRGVGCSNVSNHVISLHLQGSVYSGDSLSPYGDDGLHGSVSPSLIKLKHLKHLDLSNNNFSEPIPSFLGSLAYLEYLNLSYSGFVGEIPHQLGNLSKLVLLDLSSIDLTYGLNAKSLHWLSRLSLLRYLDLSVVDLHKATDWMQIVNNLPFLSVLRMEECQLTTQNPSTLTYVNSSTTLHVISLSSNNFDDRASLFKWLFNLSAISTQLACLDLSGNNLQGPIPSGLRNMQHLSHLDLSDNQLEGPIPSEVRNMQHLSYLGLSYNKLQGSITKVLGNLCNLKEVDLGSNNFTGELSDVIQALTRCATETLAALDLSYNRFYGSIPDTIGSFSSLRSLYLQRNQLNGKISQGIGQLSMLETLDIGSNSFNDTLTHNHFTYLSRLRELLLFHNSALVMNFSGDWFPPFQLDVVDLRSCKLGPSFPKWLQTQTNMSFLAISNANITDIVPDSLWNSFSSDLQLLDLSHNNLYGVLPNVSATLGGGTVDLSSNRFEGEAPSFFTGVGSLYLNDNLFSRFTHFLCPKTKTSLIELDLSNNLLSGELPDCWMNFDQLENLRLENNKLSGNIPKSIGTLNQLRYLHLDNNSFSGELPASLENCTSLVVLNLGYNSFTGYVPQRIGYAFENLGALILRRNNFFGELPSSLCQLSHLQILDLAINHISGTIPKCIHNFTAMGQTTNDSRLGSDTFSQQYQPNRVVFQVEQITVMNWKGEEQRFRDSLKLVKSIDLSHNELYGEIPEGISSLTGLLILDLSRNKLSGSITSEIGQLTALEELNLSNNHLTGEIPVSLAKVSSLAILDLSNNQLSGKVPLGTQLQGFNASSYMGNPGLCGAPLPKCPGDQAPTTVLNGDNVTQQVEHDDDGVFPGLYISVVLGFIIGFWGICGSLVLKRSWRLAYFRFFDDMKDRLYVMVILKIRKIWRKQ